MPIVPDSTKDRLIRRRVMIGTASNFVGQLVVFSISFLLTPFLLRSLGPTVYGLWVLAGSIVAYGAVLDFGIWGTIIKYVAQGHAQGDDALVRRLLRTILYFYLGICALISVTGIALAPLFPHVFQLPPEEHRLAGQLVALMSVATGLALPCMIPLAVLRGLQRYDLVNFIDIVTSLLTAAATVVVLLLGGGVLGLVAVNIGGLFVMLILGRVALHRIAPELLLARRGQGDAAHPPLDPQMMRMAFGHSWPLFVQTVADRLQSRTDEITIGLFLPVSQVGAYGIARRLSETTQTLTRQFMKTLLPLASQLHAEQDFARLRAVTMMGTRLTLAIVAMLSALLVALAGPILAVWVGTEYAAYAGVVALLALAYLIVTVRGSAVVILQAIARHRMAAASALVAGLANLGLSLLLVRPFGLLGVALGTVIPAALEYGCVILPYSLRVARVRPREAWSEIFGPALLPVAPMLLVLHILRTALAPSTLPAILAVAAAGLVTYLAAYLALARGDERRWLGEMALYLRRVRGMVLNGSQRGS